jgi:hypothetical protein
VRVRARAAAASPGPGPAVIRRSKATPRCSFQQEAPTFLRARTLPAARRAQVATRAERVGAVIEPDADPRHRKTAAEVVGGTDEQQSLGIALRCTPSGLSHRPLIRVHAHHTRDERQRRRRRAEDAHS